jgi:hypothetical protein
MTALGAGIALGFSESILSEWVAFALFLVITVGLGVWAGKVRPKTAFWHGAALATTANALTGFVAMVRLYNAPPEEQPSVGVPWPLFALAMMVIAAMAGAIGGVAGLAFANRFRSR